LTSLQVSVLDTTRIGSCVSASQALRGTVKVARVAESRAFHWLSVVEHHVVPDISCGSPAVMIAHLAAVTIQLRLGAGGDVAQITPPSRLPSSSACIKGRIQAASTLGASGCAVLLRPARALRSVSAENDEFSQQLDELNGFLFGDFPPDHPYAGLRTSLQVSPLPLHLLGTSEVSAHLAASRGIPFAFTHHVNLDASPVTLAAYRTNFRCCGGLEKMSVAVVCAPNQQEAEIIRVCHAVALRENLPASDEVLRYPHRSDEERSLVNRKLCGGWILVGTPDQFAQGLRELYRATRSSTVTSVSG